MTAALVTALLLTACTDTGPGTGATIQEPSGSAASTPTSATAPVVDVRTREAAELRARLTPPALPSFALPSDVLTDVANQRIAAQLQVLPGLYRDIAVLDAYCDPAGDAVAADSGRTPQASTARTVKDGDVSVTVAGDGTGVYDAAGLHLAVLPGGAGVYDDGDTRVSVNADGTGTYESADLRVFVRPDGSGSYQSGTGEEEVRAWIDPDHSGSYRGPEGRVTVDASGATGGGADPDFAAAVATVFHDGLPAFPAVPRITRVEPAGTSCGTVVRLDAGVLFEFDSDQLRPEGRQLLQRVAPLLESLGEPAVDVVGHTDSSGDEVYNQRLSERRAGTVTDELVAEGVPRGSLRPLGRGESEPVRPDVDATGVPDPTAQQLNRRVELVLRHTP